MSDNTEARQLASAHQDWVASVWAPTRFPKDPDIVAALHNAGVSGESHWLKLRGILMFAFAKHGRWGTDMWASMPTIAGPTEWNEKSIRTYFDVACNVGMIRLVEERVNETNIYEAAHGWSLESLRERGRSLVTPRTVAVATSPEPDWVTESTDAAVEADPIAAAIAAVSSVKELDETWKRYKRDGWNDEHTQQASAVKAALVKPADEPTPAEVEPEPAAREVPDFLRDLIPA